MNFIKKWSVIIAALNIGMFVTSCDKNNLVENGQIDANKLLMLDDLELGKSYPFEVLDQSVIDILQIDVSRKARSITYRILHRADITGGCTAIEIAYPYPSSYTQDLDASWLLWTKNPGWNGTYTYTWTGTSCSDDDELWIKRYYIENGDLTPVSDDQYGPTHGPGVSGDLEFSDGGWEIGSMEMN